MSENYSLLLKQAESLLATETDAIANAANLASLIYHGVDQVNWAGFYFLKGNELVLGPFMGQVACTRIAIGKGVCGRAFEQQKVIVVDDVHQFDGHIACDAASQSEIVIPFKPFKRADISGVLDVDSPIKQRFLIEEQSLFREIVKMYRNS